MRSLIYGNTLKLLIKLGSLIQISVLISEKVRPIQSSEEFDRTNIW